MYRMSILHDPSTRKKLLPSQLPKTKLRYLKLEAVGDLMPDRWGSMEFFAAIIALAAAMWLTMFAHYIGQYLYLRGVGAIVYGFKINAWEVQFKYMSSAMGDVAEVGAVFIGPVSALLWFLLCTLFAHACYVLAGHLPEGMSVCFSYMGLCAVLDPVLIAIYNLAVGRFNCESNFDACEIDYTSNDCDCFNGDIVKLWNRFERVEGVGITGILITFIIYAVYMTITALCYYLYLVHVHRNARILDLWRRINSPPEEFFIPDDLEISFEELRSVVSMSSQFKGSNGALRKVAVSSFYERDPLDPLFERKSEHVAVYTLELTGEKTLHRHFLIQWDGAILELFGAFSLDLSQQNRILERLLQKYNPVMQLAESDRKLQSFGDVNTELEAIFQ